MSKKRHKRSRSTGWMQEHLADTYVKKAQEGGYRSRAVFKLQEIDTKDRLFQQDSIVVDLGAAPGGWSQYAREQIGPTGRVIALDLLSIASIPGVEVIQGDFREAEVLQSLRERLGNDGADLVMSDMAPNMSGMRVIDQPRAMHLAELALELAQEVLRPEGTLLVKVFQGAGYQEYVGELRKVFRRVATRKPKASRPRSREAYILAQRYNL